MTATAMTTTTRKCSVLSQQRVLAVHCECEGCAQLRRPAAPCVQPLWFCLASSQVVLDIQQLAIILLAFSPPILCTL